jgi:hypoxanthine phosphoribosyltransferase
MNRHSVLIAMLCGMQKAPSNGVIGLVEELLEFCRTGPFRFTWRPNRVSFKHVFTGKPEEIELTIRNSVMRAAVARLAALASRGKSEAINPYGGKGQIHDDQHPETVYQIEFKNTEDEQLLEILPIHKPKPYKPIDLVAISLVSKDRVRDRIFELALSIGNENWDEPISIFWVANGAFFFASDLIRQMRFRKLNMYLEVIRATSYENNQQNALRHDAVQLDFSKHRGRRIFLVDDIIDSGNTLHDLKSLISEKLPDSQIETIVLTCKVGCQKVDIVPDHVGFHIGQGSQGESAWIVGMGMDDDGLYRCEPGIYAKKINGWPRKAKDVPITVDGLNYRDWVANLKSRKPSSV